MYIEKISQRGRVRMPAVRPEIDTIGHPLMRDDNHDRHPTSSAIKAVLQRNKKGARRTGPPSCISTSGAISLRVAPRVQLWGCAPGYHGTSSTGKTQCWRCLRSNQAAQRLP
jgi:hypothetical protein